MNRDTLWLIDDDAVWFVGWFQGKPAYIFPFLGYQLGDLFVSTLTVAGVICLGPNIKELLLSGVSSRREHLVFPVSMNVENEK